MTKLSVNIFPKLRGKMAECKDDVNSLADRLGVSPSTVRRRMRGERDFKLNELTVLAKRYGESIEELFKEE